MRLPIAKNRPNELNRRRATVLVAVLTIVSVLLLAAYHYSDFTMAEHQAAHPRKRSLHRRELLHHVRAVRVLLDHAKHPVQMAACRAKPVDHRLPIDFVHTDTLPHLGWGSTCKSPRT